jgi:hypothetical protein
MAYERLRWPPVSERLSSVLSLMSHQLADIRELMIVRAPNGVLSVATLLAVMTDSAANLLEPSEKEHSDRFRKFLKDNFPWTDDRPYGLEVADAIDLLWEVVRTPAVHRLGLQPDPIFQVKYVMIFTVTDETMSALELSDESSLSEPTIKFDGTTLTIQLESWYWGLRRAIVNAVNTKAKVDAIATHIQSGAFARTNTLLKLLKAEVPRAKKGKSKA